MTKYLNNQTVKSGVGSLDLLLIAFIVLKLTGHIDWSWWWVMAPFWIPCALVGVACLGYGAYWLYVRAALKRKGML